MINEHPLTMKGKFVPMYAMNAYGGADAALLILIHSTRQRCLAALLPKMNSPVPKERKDGVLRAASKDIFEMTKISCP